jgi:hypothetical protein
MAIAPVLKTGVRKDLGVRIPRPPLRVAAASWLVALAACHGGFHRATVPRCAGDNAVIAHNASNGSVDLYISLRGPKDSRFLGTAPVGDTEFPLPPLAGGQDYAFQVRDHGGTQRTASTGTPSRVRLERICKTS